MAKPTASRSSESPLRPNDYKWIKVVAFSHVLGLVALLVFLTTAFPASEKVFSDFGTVRPVISQWIMFCYRNLIYCCTLFVFFMVVDIALLAVLRLNDSTFGLARAWAIVVWVGIISAFIVIILSIALPLMSLIHDLA